MSSTKRVLLGLLVALVILVGSAGAVAGYTYFNKPLKAVEYALELKYQWMDVVAFVDNNGEAYVLILAKEEDALVADIQEGLKELRTDVDHVANFYLEDGETMWVVFATKYLDKWYAHEHHQFQLVDGKLTQIGIRQSIFEIGGEYIKWAGRNAPIK